MIEHPNARGPARPQGEKQRPQILVVVRHPVGGIRTWFRYIYSQPAFRRYRLTIALPDGPEVKALEDSLNLPGIEFARIGHSPSGFVCGVSKLLSRRRFDLVHSHGFGAAILVSLPAAISRHAHLITQHDVLLEKQFQGARGAGTKRALGCALRLATRVHSVGYSAAENLASVFPFLEKQKGKVCVVRNGVDTDHFWNASPEDVRASLDIPDQRPVIGFFGRYMAQKGFRYIVDALPRLEARLGERTPVILAVGDGGYRAREERELHRLGLHHHFRFLDFRADIAPILKSVDLVVMPSLWEAFALQPMEAASAGTPIVLSDCPSLLEVARCFPARVVQAGSGAALAEGIFSEIEAPRNAITQQWAADHRHIFAASVAGDGMLALYEDMVPS